MRKTTTIFRQLILNVVIPSVVALSVLGIANYYHTKKILLTCNTQKNMIISDEITHILELQDMALEILEQSLDKKMKLYSDKLVQKIFRNSKDIENADLKLIREQLGMNPEMEDIYIINSDGIVVNTTFEQDLNLNFFSFGEEHKNHLLHVLEGNEFVRERFAIEATTRRLKKYTYQPTNDGRYIIELGVYSETADDIIGFIKKTLNDLSNKAVKDSSKKNEQSIVSVDLFIGEDNPFSLQKETKITSEQIKDLKKVFERKDTITVLEKEEEQSIEYQYIYMDRKNTDLYKGSVIRIVSDRTSEINMLKGELYKFLFIFGLTLFVVMLLTYKKTKVITDPIKKLVDNVNRITDGHLNERADVEGNNEITKLSEQFNMMIEQLESYYFELEQKVEERTREIAQQKEEIEAQRDSITEAFKEIEEQKKHITDSIHYAKRIQNAILPPQDYVKEKLPDSFILYKPKDIVSGDFYWLTEKDDMVMFSAVDCTGHGVPGAFMSIVGNNQLNYAVNVVGARKASHILDALNEGVSDTLRERDGLSSVKDGMDLALCTINIKEKKLQFAGAYNPLCLIRNNELILIKGDKFPIGGGDAELKKFTNHELDLQEGDAFYLYSDGYADQFGGENGRKFLTKRFRQLLLDIHLKPMDKQKEILENTFEDWRGAEEQIDDVLVIGVKI